MLLLLFNLIDMASNILQSIYIYSHRQMLLSALIKETPPCSEGSKSRECGLQKGGESEWWMNTQSYTRIKPAKAQGTL